MPAVVTTRYTPGTQNNSAIGPFNETGICQMKDTRDIDYIDL